MKLLLFLLTAVSVSFAQAKKPMKPSPKAAAPAVAPAPRAAPMGHAAHKSGAYSRPYGMAGCGLGTLIMDKRSSQVLVATTNGTGVQTIGITLGTSNCVDEATSQVADKMDKYIHINKVQLAGDIAKGNGETIVALSEVIGCQSSQNLGSALKASYRDVFANDFTTNEVTDSIITVIQQDSQLSQECSLAQI
ncbi:MAG: hypothetical protein B7Y39_16340 [Bdellovibrio sp. 28-41-41]|nr:MAG: hypothetical protein B7Y39_16340 [Bdellovibrio sp. 28-41-41]